MTETNKPKYQKLRDYIIETIESEKVAVGEKIYSESYLSEIFEISRSTVRQAIGELVNEGWLYRVQGKGTFVNRHPGEKNDSLKTIGVLTTYLNDYIFPSIIRGIDNVLTMNNYNMILSCTYNEYHKERLCLENLLNSNISGLIVEPTKSALPNPNIDLYKRFAELGIPVVFIHGSYRELDCSYIVEDDTEAGYLATKHLIALGHEKIGGIFKIDDIQGHCRFSGFQRAYRETNLQVEDSSILWYQTSDFDTKFEDHNLQLEKLLSQCTAIVCYNDQIALKVMDIIRDKNLKIPEDISLVSFDDSQLAVASETKLTTVAHPKEKLGEEAAKAIINLLDKKEIYYDLKIKPELVVRNSTKEYSPPTL